VINLSFVIAGTAKRQLGILLFKGRRKKYYRFLYVIPMLDFKMNLML